MPEEFYPMDEDWDYLLVLDACRYDYFEDLYGDYFEGELRKIRSPGSETSEWCRKVFTEKYDDVVYVSGNPRINSKIKTKDFEAPKHFHKIIDVWDWGWNDGLGTVLPQVVNKAVLEAKKSFPDKRLIVQYLQPHAPYLSLSLDCNSENIKGGVNPKRLSLLRKMLFRFSRCVGQKYLWKIRELFGAEPSSPIYLAYRECGEKGLIKAYKKNLSVLLEYIAEIYSKLSGDVVITSDHGELLGEGGNFGHYSNLREPELLEVPWFKVKKAKMKENISEKEKIERKVKNLVERKNITGDVFDKNFLSLLCLP